MAYLTLMWCVVPFSFIPLNTKNVYQQTAKDHYPALLGGDT